MSGMELRSVRSSYRRCALLLVTWMLIPAERVLAQRAPGERLDTAAFGRSVIESMDVVAARERARPDLAGNQRAGGDRSGAWVVPPRSAASGAHSGTRCVINRFGDTCIGIGFGAPVDVAGAWIAGAGAPEVFARALQAVGYRAGVEVARTPWFETIGAEPAWFSIELAAVDRIEFVALSASQGAGWFALDDLSFVRAVDGDDAPFGRQNVVIDFEDLAFKTVLTGSGYGGLAWEVGRGTFDSPEGPPPAPRAPASTELDVDAPADGAPSAPAPLAVPPAITASFAGPAQGDPASLYSPPDTCGAVGLEHFVVAINNSVSVFSKQSGQRLFTSSLNAFFGTSNLADPRVVFDPHSQRFFVIATDFGTTVHLAMSLSADPLGAWFKAALVVSQGSDAPRHPDYPTLGVDAHGVYVAAAMFANAPAKMSIFAIDKAPLLASTPSVGTVTAWRGLPYEHAIQPCVTYGLPGAQHFVSRRSSTQLRLRALVPPLDAPALVELGFVNVPSHASPPDAPALGSAARIETMDVRPMNAVFRNGSVWTAHNIGLGGRAAVRWYELDPSALAAVQVGTVADAARGYYFGTLAVNANSDVVLGCSGSSPTEYISAFVAGRRANDPPGSTSLPIRLMAGEGPYMQLDYAGRNRWGDYSLTSVDPVDDQTIWSIQQYARTSNRWGTWIARLAPGCPGTPDCNANGVADTCDIAGALSADHNGSGVPDECEGFDGAPFCFGDGSLANACPCVQPDAVPFPSGASDAGCANSWSASGARLFVSGTTAPDTLAFRAVIGAHYTGFAYLLKGDGQNASGVAFGDGVRCVDGALLAFGGHPAATNGSPPGEWSYPNSAQTRTVGAATGQLPATTAYYQLVYRNAQAGFCSPGTSNVSNAFRIAW